MAHIRMNFFSQALQKNANVTVFLPTVSSDDFLADADPAKYDPARRYQTLYLLHGAYGDCVDWSRLTSVERYAQEHCLAVVMPSGENSFYRNMDCGERYLDYIAHELPQFLGRIFPLSRKREDTFIAGLSMGGYGCMSVALRYPERYAAAAALSGGFDLEGLSRPGGPSEKMGAYFTAVFGENGPKNDLVELLKTALAQGKTLPRLYMAVGTEDFVFPANEAFYAQIRPLADVTYETFPGIHNWDFWDKHIQGAMDWLPLAGEKVAP